MQQTFLGFVTSDLRFWASSVAAILRSVLIPLAAVSVVAGLVSGPAGAAWVFAGAALFTACDWAVLIVRMARRIALRLEDPDALLDRTVLANAGYLHRAYYAGRMPTLRPARG